MKNTAVGEKIAAFADNFEGKWGSTLAGIPVVSPEECLRQNPDCVCLCVLDAERAGQMEAQLRQLGFEGEILRPDALRTFDARAATMRLLAEQIREENIPGAAAELGVYRGSFARCINTLLPERTLYLFDTFSGFDSEEAAGEGEGFVAAHKNTGAERVLAAMPCRSRVILRQGLFPETAQGLEERFALVSLDVDLEESTLAGLRWFLPRIVPGGYLLLHDYFSPALPGVGAALARWEAESGVALHKVPVCDVNGTLILSL